MPMFDRKCPICALVHFDRLEPAENPPVVPCEGCGAPTERVWLMGRANSVIGDECDVWVRHGLCNADGTPRHFDSKIAMAKEAKARGLVNHVTHQPGRGTDKSRHTVRWI